MGAPQIRFSHTLMPFPKSNPSLERALADRGYNDPTPVQAAVLQPEALDHDLLVSAQTGSGKTVAYGLAMASTLLGDSERFDAPREPLALIIAPIATELPEKFNSVLWVRNGKDTLAMGNITGAMVFQSTIPIAVGLTLTDWELDRFAVLSGALGLAGGVVAYWALRLRGRFEPLPIVLWSALFAAFIVYVSFA